MNEQLTELYKEAYYEVLYEHITRENPDYDLLIEILEDVKHRISNILRRGSQLYNEIDQSIDIQFIKQMLENQAFSIQDFKQLIVYIFDKCKQLCSPARDKYTDDKLQEILEKIHNNDKFADIALLFIKNVNDCIEYLYFDLHKYYAEIESAS